MITTASSLHDIGKIGIPDRILEKPGRLTDEEYEEFLKEIRKLLSDKETFINTQKNYINELKNKGILN